jgi:hypothetical protein
MGYWALVDRISDSVSIYDGADVFLQLLSTARTVDFRQQPMLMRR